MILDQTFLTERGFLAYQDYLAITRHFSTTYDYFKYNGKVNVSYDKFISRRDAYQFQRLGKKKDYKNVILSNVIENPKLWIGTLFEEQATQTYLQWKKKTDSITMHLKDSLTRLDTDFKANFISVGGQYPHILDLYLRKELSLEVTCILTKLTNSSEYWNTSVIDKVVFPDIIRKIDKYHPFLVYSTDKVKKVVKDHFF
jgi:hypothetical protein